MDANVLDYEPHSALFVPNEDPLRFYRAITLYASKAIVPGGRLYFEINQSYGKEIEKLLSNNGFINIAIMKDMYANYRFASATKPTE